MKKVFFLAVSFCTLFGKSATAQSVIPEFKLNDMFHFISPLDEPNWQRGAITSNLNWNGASDQWIRPMNHADFAMMRFGNSGTIDFMSGETWNASKTTYTTDEMENSYKRLTISRFGINIHKTWLYSKPDDGDGFRIGFRTAEQMGFNVPNPGWVDYMTICKTDANEEKPDGGILFTNKGQDGEVPSMLINGNGDIGINTVSPKTGVHFYDKNLLFENSSNDPDHKLLLFNRTGVLGEEAEGFKFSWRMDDVYEIRKDVLIFENSGRIHFPHNILIGRKTESYTDGDFVLSVSGKMRAEEIKVAVGWADYVFDDNYELMSLEETEAYIEENKHLPGIPSEKEIEENEGVELGEMQKLHMAKIEELTLYTIEQEKKIENQEKSIEAQNERIEQLEKLVLKLSKVIE